MSTSEKLAIVWGLLLLADLEIFSGERPDEVPR
jgi:hypothetical protein